MDTPTPHPPKFPVDVALFRQQYHIDSTDLHHMLDGGYASIYRVGNCILRISQESEEIAQLEDSIRQVAGKHPELAVDDAILTKDGHRHVTVGDTVWRLTPYAEGTILKTSEITDLHLTHAAIELAKFHNIMAELDAVPAPDYRHLPVVHLPNIAVAHDRVDSLLQKLSRAPREHDHFIVSQRDFILAQFDTLQNTTNAVLHTLPTMAVHGDYWRGNILFRPDGNVAQIVDFGMSGLAPRISDLIGPLLETDAKLPDLDKFATFLDAYQSAAVAKITPAELGHIKEDFRRFSLQEIFYELYVWGTGAAYDFKSIEKRIAALKTLDNFKNTDFFSKKNVRHLPLSR